MKGFMLTFVVMGVSFLLGAGGSYLWDLKARRGAIQQDSG